MMLRKNTVHYVLMWLLFIVRRSADCFKIPRLVRVLFDNCQFFVAVLSAVSSIVWCLYRLAFVIKCTMEYSALLQRSSAVDKCRLACCSMLWMMPASYVNMQKNSLNSKILSSVWQPYVTMFCVCIYYIYMYI